MSTTAPIGEGVPATAGGSQEWRKHPFRIFQTSIRSPTVLTGRPAICLSAAR